MGGLKNLCTCIGKSQKAIVQLTCIGRPKLMMKKVITFNHLYCKVIYTQRFDPEQSKCKLTQAHASPGRIGFHQDARKNIH